MVRRHRGNAAPVIDARIHQSPERAGIEIWRRLDVHLRLEQEPRHRDRPKMLVNVERRHVRHPRPGLGPEILDNDFLDMAVGIVEIAQRKERVDPLFARFTNANQDAGGKGHGLLAGEAHRLQPRRRHFVGRAMMRLPLLAKTLRCRLEHDALRDRDVAKRRDIGARHQSGIDMRQQPSFAEHGFGGLRQIGQRGRVAEPSELLAAPCDSAARACRPR